MFEKIKFENVATPLPITPDIINGILLNNKETSTDLDQLQNHAEHRAAILFMQSQMKNLDFYLDGTIKLFHIPPISKYAAENLMYLADFNLYDYRCPSFSKREYYPYYLLFYTYNGYGYLEYEGRHYHLGEGDGFFIDGRKPHKFGCSSDYWYHASAAVCGPTIPELYKNFAENGNPVFSQSITDSIPEGFEKLLCLYSIAEPYRDWQVSNNIGNMLTDLLVSSLSESSRTAATASTMRHLIRYMEKNYTEPISVEQLTKDFGISRSQLFREFKKYTGFAPNDYLIQVRINAAKRLLGSSAMSVAEVAYAVGFHNINNFTNMFKKITGMTPSEYRKQV
ncbi:MAG: helix-turn-helix domain-containing protein [Lachnospiraceae bacterium]